MLQGKTSIAAEVFENLPYLHTENEVNEFSKPLMVHTMLFFFPRTTLKLHKDATFQVGTVSAYA